MKGLIIPPRIERDNSNIKNKQVSYCEKTECTEPEVDCEICLFQYHNIGLFTEWYLNKNKVRSKW